MKKLLAGVVLSLALAAPANAAPIEIGHIPECTEAVPAAISLPPGATGTLNVRVLLDGVSQARGQQVIDQARASYSPLGISVAASYQAVSFGGTDADALNQQAKGVFGGQRPAGTDIVYTLTNKDIQAGGNTAVAGLADCIGGVAFADKAFAVGENFVTDDSLLAKKMTAKVAAHEIGHLMGGHHHYANCAEGLLSEVGEEVSPCTLMFNAVDTTSFNFSQLNSLVVRGHSEAYAN